MNFPELEVARHHQQLIDKFDQKVLVVYGRMKANESVARIHFPSGILPKGLLQLKILRFDFCVLAGHRHFPTVVTGTYPTPVAYSDKIKITRPKMIELGKRRRTGYFFPDLPVLRPPTPPPPVLHIGDVPEGQHPEGEEMALVKPIVDHLLLAFEPNRNNLEGNKRFRRANEDPPDSMDVVGRYSKTFLLSDRVIDLTKPDLKLGDLITLVNKEIETLYEQSGSLFEEKPVVSFELVTDVERPAGNTDPLLGVVQITVPSKLYLGFSNMEHFKVLGFVQTRLAKTLKPSGLAVLDHDPTQTLTFRGTVPMKQDDDLLSLYKKERERSRAGSKKVIEKTDGAMQVGLIFPFVNIEFVVRLAGPSYSKIPTNVTDLTMVHFAEALEMIRQSFSFSDDSFVGVEKIEDKLVFGQIAYPENLAEDKLNIFQIEFNLTSKLSKMLGLGQQKIVLNQTNAPLIVTVEDTSGKADFDSLSEEDQQEQIKMIKLVMGQVTMRNPPQRTPYLVQKVVDWNAYAESVKIKLEEEKRLQQAAAESAKKALETSKEVLKSLEEQTRIQSQISEGAAAGAAAGPTPGPSGSTAGVVKPVVTETAGGEPKPGPSGSKKGPTTAATTTTTTTTTTTASVTPVVTAPPVVVHPPLTGGNPPPAPPLPPKPISSSVETFNQNVEADPFETVEIPNPRIKRARTFPIWNYNKKGRCSGSQNFPDQYYLIVKRGEGNDYIVDRGNVTILALMKKESPIFQNGILLKNFEYERDLELEIMSTQLDVYTVPGSRNANAPAVDGFIRATFLVKPLSSVSIL